MLIDKILEEMKQRQGIQTVVDPILIDELKQGHVTYRFEIQPEMRGDQPQLRLMCTTFSGSGSTGKSRKTFDWPVQDPKQELNHISDAILASLESNAKKLDHRGWFGRTFDNLTANRYLNHIPLIAEHHQYGFRCWLWAYITENNQLGQLVTLYHEREKKSPMSFTLPVDSYRALQQKLDAETNL